MGASPAIRLIDLRNGDGSRHFACLPRDLPLDVLCDHILQLPGADVSNRVTAGVTQQWIDFGYRGHRFSVRELRRQYHLLVENAQCPEVILEQLAAHFAQLLGDR